MVEVEIFTISFFKIKFFWDPFENFIRTIIIDEI
jgi:hypothetical protein